MNGAHSFTEGSDCHKETRPSEVRSDALLDEAYAIIGTIGKDMTYAEERQNWKRASEWCWMYQDRKASNADLERTARSDGTLQDFVGGS